tara:strand:- start:358 stop:549 length:192 start_codon:yes stop_codon:yes gene_type:complete
MLLLLTRACMKDSFPNVEDAIVVASLFLPSAPLKSSFTFSTFPALSKGIFLKPSFNALSPKHP